MDNKLIEYKIIEGYYDFWDISDYEIGLFIGLLVFIIFLLSLKICIDWVIERYKSK